MEIEDPHGKEAHDYYSPNHSGKRGHFCMDWDLLWICEDCLEFQACCCSFSDSGRKSASAPD